MLCVCVSKVLHSKSFLSKEMEEFNKIKIYSEYEKEKYSICSNNYSFSVFSSLLMLFLDKCYCCSPF